MENEIEFKVGDLVEIQNLTGKDLELNGQKGKIINTFGPHFTIDFPDLSPYNINVINRKCIKHIPKMKPKFIPGDKVQIISKRSVYYGQQTTILHEFEPNIFTTSTKKGARLIRYSGDSLEKFVYENKILPKLAGGRGGGSGFNGAISGIAITPKQISEKELLKKEINLERLIGQFIGILEGICFWDIPEALKDKLKVQIEKLTNI